MAVQLLNSQSRIDVIQLKSGAKIMGKILGKTNAESLQIELESHQVIEVSNENINKIDSLFVNLKPGIFILPITHSIVKDTNWIINSVSGTLAMNVSLDSIRNSILYISNKRNVDSIDIKEIIELRKINETQIWKYARNVALTSGVFGAIISFLTAESGFFSRGDVIFTTTAIFGTIGFVIGGIGGIISGVDTVIEISSTDQDDLLTQWQELFRRIK